MRKLVLSVILAVLLSGCSGGVNSTPGVYEPLQESYDAYDATVLSGQQADSSLQRLKERLAVIVVKGKDSYVFGDAEKAVPHLSHFNQMDSYDRENVIDINGTYHSLVLRDMNNKVIGIQLTERETTHIVSEKP